jgi:hypothetical protein
MELTSFITHQSRRTHTRTHAQAALMPYQRFSTIFSKRRTVEFELEMRYCRARTVSKCCLESDHTTSSADAPFMTTASCGNRAIQCFFQENATTVLINYIVGSIKSDDREIDIC